MDNLLKYDMGDIYIRTGKPVNIAEQMDELEKKYRVYLSADIEAFETYDEVSSETLSDLDVVRACLGIYNKLGYIDDEELKNMIECAGNLRKTMLEALNG